MKNFKVTSRVKSIEELLAVLKQEHPIVYVSRWGSHSPVAFLQNWQAHRLHKWIQSGYIYHVRPKVIDRNGEEIKDGDSFLHYCINNGDPVKGKRVDDMLIWEDGIIHKIDDWWSSNDSKDFKRIEAE